MRSENKFTSKLYKQNPTSTIWKDPINSEVYISYYKRKGAMHLLFRNKNYKTTSCFRN